MPDPLTTYLEIPGQQINGARLCHWLLWTWQVPEPAASVAAIDQKLSYIVVVEMPLLYIMLGSRQMG